MLHVQRLIWRAACRWVRMQLLDYRALQVDAPFDKIASVGMFRSRMWGRKWGSTRHR